MRRPDHERIEELLTPRVLGGLDETEERELRDAMTSHGTDCAECRRLERELTEVAALLPLALDPLPVDPTLPDRVLAAVPRREVSRAQGDGPAAESTTPLTPVDEVAERRARARPRSRTARLWASIAGVAAVVAAIVVLAATVVRSPVEVTRAEPAGRVVRFEPTRDPVDGRLVMAYAPGERGALLWGRLPDPGEGHVYEIWMIEDDTPTSAGCARPLDGRIALFVDADLGSTDTMAVTVEPTACPPQPTGPVVVAAPLAAA
jgi:hypothetical protein